MNNDPNPDTIDNVLRSLSGSDQTLAAWQEIGRSLAAFFTELTEGGVPILSATEITSTAIASFIETSMGHHS